jgi:hypothetical protein
MCWSRLRGLEIDYQIEPGRLLDRNVGPLGLSFPPTVLAFAHEVIE